MWQFPSLVRRMRLRQGLVRLRQLLRRMKKLVRVPSCYESKRQRTLTPHARHFKLTSTFFPSYELCDGMLTIRSSEEEREGEKEGEEKMKESSKLYLFFLR